MIERGTALGRAMRRGWEGIVDLLGTEVGMELESGTVRVRGSSVRSRRQSHRCSLNRGFFVGIASLKGSHILKCVGNLVY